jgi:hypothetical protein
MPLALDMGRNRGTGASRQLFPLVLPAISSLQETTVGQSGESPLLFPVDSHGNFKGTVVVPTIGGAGNGAEVYQIIPGMYKFALNYAYAAKPFVSARFQVVKLAVFRHAWSYVCTGRVYLRTN